MARFADVLTIINGKSKLKIQTANIPYMEAAVLWDMQMISFAVEKP